MDTGIHGIGFRLINTATTTELIKHLNENYMSTFKIGDHLSVSFVLGTGKFGSSQEMEEAILASGSEMVTVALKESI
jgi:hypothetical protein